MAARTIRLILGDQLDPRHSWFTTRQPDTLYVLVEVRRELEVLVHHIPKIVSTFAAMRRFADTLRRAGHREVLAAGARWFGNIDPGNVLRPLGRGQALALLERFVRHGLSQPCPHGLPGAAQAPGSGRSMPGASRRAVSPMPGKGRLLAGQPCPWDAEP